MSQALWDTQGMSRQQTNGPFRFGVAEATREQGLTCLIILVSSAIYTVPGTRYIVKKWSLYHEA